MENSPKKENEWKTVKPSSRFDANNNWRGNLTVTLNGSVRQVSKNKEPCYLYDTRPVFLRRTYHRNAVSHVTEEVILNEERTTEEERMHILEGMFFGSTLGLSRPSEMSHTCSEWVSIARRGSKRSNGPEKAIKNRALLVRSWADPNCWKKRLVLPRID